MVFYSMVPVKGEPFKLTSILKEEPPAGTEGIGWHRYVIIQGENTITGHRQGSTASVTLAAEEIVLHLNERRVGTFSRAYVSRHPYRKIKSST